MKTKSNSVVAVMLAVLAMSSCSGQVSSSNNSSNSSICTTDKESVDYYESVYADAYSDQVSGIVIAGIKLNVGYEGDKFSEPIYQFIDKYSGCLSQSAFDYYKNFADLAESKGY